MIELAICITVGNVIRSYVPSSEYVFSVLELKDDRLRLVDWTGNKSDMNNGLLLPSKKAVSLRERGNFGKHRFPLLIYNTSPPFCPFWFLSDSEMQVALRSKRITNGFRRSNQASILVVVYP